MSADADLIRKLAGGDLPQIERFWTPAPGDVCLDAGFGPGCWALVALARGAAVYAFDPNEHSNDMLARALLENGFTKCCIVRSGLWDSAGPVPFVTNQFDAAADHKHDRATITLDDFTDAFGLSRLDWINMDAEHAEVRIVAGGVRTIGRFRPKIVVELHHESYRDQIKEKLASAGPYRFEDDGGFLFASC